jgi:hypothetical protein
MSFHCGYLQRNSGVHECPKMESQSGKEAAMSRPETEDIAKGNLVVPSHKPLAGADEPPIDAGLQDTPQRQ